MDKITVDPDQWRALYDLAGRVWALAPWNYMGETDLFGVEPEADGEIGFVSVMGALGQHKAVAVYLGPRGLYDFITMQVAEGEVPPEALLDMPQVQLSFANKSDLEDPDRDVLGALGLAFKGRKAWPMFRSYRPSCLPWFLESPEIGLLQVALEQLLDVAPRFQREPTCLGTGQTEAILVRSRSGGAEGEVWRERFVTVPPPGPERIEIRIEPDVAEAVARLPSVSGAIEIDCFRTPTVVAEPGQRPFFPYVLMLGDPQSGLILGTELVDPTPSLADMWGALPSRLLQQLARLGWAPTQLVTKEDLLAQVLGVIAPRFGFELRTARRLSALEPAKKSLLRSFGSR